MTLSEMAFKSGIPQPSLSRYSSGKSDITLRQLNRLCTALDLKLNNLLEEKKDFLKNNEKILALKEKQETGSEKAWVSRVMWELNQHYLKVRK